MARRTKRLTAQGEEKDVIRINKFLSDAGVCSRREADRYILEGKVMVDGVAALMGSKVSKDSIVTFCNKPVKREEKLVLIAFNKPEGIVCTTDQSEPDNIIDYIDYGMRIYPIGRLDKDSEGLILLTNDGDIVNKILRAENRHEKEYIVTVNKEINPEFIKKMSSGVPILDTVTNPCKVTQNDKYTFNIVLTQGLNRQIRRMCEALGYRVTNLKRIRIMNIQLGRLKRGDFRNVTHNEIEELNKAFQQQKSMPDNRTHREAKYINNVHPGTGHKDGIHPGTGHKDGIHPGTKRADRRVTGNAAYVSIAGVDNHIDRGTGCANTKYKRTGIGTGGANAKDKRTRIGSSGINTQDKRAGIGAGGANTQDKRTGIGTSGANTKDKRTGIGSGSANTKDKRTGIGTGGANMKDKRTRIGSGAINSQDNRVGRGNGSRNKSH